LAFTPKLTAGVCSVCLTSIFARRRDQVHVVVQDVSARQQMFLVWLDSQILKLGSGFVADAERTANGNSHAATPGYLIERRCHPPRLKELSDKLERPDIGAAGAGVVVCAEDGSDLVVLKTCGENVRCAVAARIGDKYDRTVIPLPDVGATLCGRNRKSG
jgi:hypothetical protein